MKVKSLAKLTQPLLILLGIDAILNFFNFICSIWLYYDLDKLPPQASLYAIEFPLSEYVGAIFSLFYIIFIFPLMFIFLCWIYRLSKNLHVLSVAPFKYSEAWSVISYFIPLINLVSPFLAMKELWTRAFKDEPESRSREILGGWWFLWLAANFSGRTSFKMSTNAETVMDYQAAMGVTAFAEFIGILLSLIAMVLVYQISSAYYRNYDEEAANTEPDNPEVPDVPEEPVNG